MGAGALTWPLHPCPQGGGRSRTELAPAARIDPPSPGTETSVKNPERRAWRGSGLMDVLEGDAPQRHRARAPCSRDRPGLALPATRPSGSFLCPL